MERAQHFFDAAVEHGWDTEQGGFVYNFDRNGDAIAKGSYYWKLAEGFAAAALLATVTGDATYWEWYDRIWDYAWNHMINRKHGNWYFKLTADNEIHNDIDTTPEVKCGYHPVGACYDVLTSLP